MYKKILGILLVFALSSPVFAQDLSALCTQPHDLSMKGTRFIANISGMTLLSQAIANSIVKSELKKSTGAKGFKVKMKSFSAKDLADGRFKSLNISGKNLDFDGIYVSEFKASTVCDFNYIKATPKSITFKDNFAMNYSMTISDTDLNKTVLSKDYLAFLKSLNVKAGGLNLMELKDVDVRLKNDKLYFKLQMDNKVFSYNIPVFMNVSTKMKVEDNKIKLTEVTLENLNQKINLTQFTNMINMINPLNFTVDVLGNDKTKVSLQSMDIKGDKLVLAGTMFVPKNAQETRK